MKLPQVDVDVKAKSTGLWLHFPWASVVFILIFIACAGYTGYVTVNQKIDVVGNAIDIKLERLNTTLDGVSNAAHSLSQELSTIREFYSRLDTKVAVIDSRVSHLETQDKKK